MYCPDPQSQMQFGYDLAKKLQQKPALIYLQGELGAGKTTLVKGFLKARGYSGLVKSPTYTLIESYPVQPPVHHLDLYRLTDGEELEWIGFRELFQKKEHILIEWPEKAADYLPPPDLIIQIQWAQSGRYIELIENNPLLYKSD